MFTHFYMVFNNIMRLLEMFLKCICKRSVGLDGEASKRAASAARAGDCTACAAGARQTAACAVADASSAQLRATKLN